MANDVRIHVSVQDDASATLRQVGQETDKLGTSAAGTGSSMLSMGVALAAVTAAATVAAGVVYSFYATNRDLELQLRKSTTVFAEQLPVVKEWADSNAAAMGLSSNQATNLAASMADLLIPMGMTREAATEMATKTIGLSGALAEWSGGQRTATEVARILQKAFLGETDGLKELGIAISAEQVMAELATRGQEDLTGSALEQAKALAIQKLVFDKSTDAQAAYADGAGTAARSQAELTARLTTAHEQMAQALAPAIAAVAGALVGVLVPAVDGLVVVFEFAVKHGTLLVSTLAGLSTTIAVLMIPKLLALTAATWAYVAALAAQAIAFALANPLLAVAAVAAGALMAATVALMVGTEKSTDATGKNTEGKKQSAQETAKATEATRLSKEQTEAHQKATEAFTKATTYLTAATAAQAFASSIAAAAVRGSAEEQVAAEETGLRLVKATMLQAAANKAVVDGLMLRAESELGIGVAQKVLTSVTAGATSASREHTTALADEKRAANELESSINSLIRSQAGRMTTSLPGELASKDPIQAAGLLKQIQQREREIFTNTVLDAANKSIQRGADPGEAFERANRILNPAPAASDLDRIFGGGSSSTTINVAVSGIVLDPIGTGQAIADALNQASLSTGALVLSGAVQQ